VEQSVDTVHRFARELRPAVLDDLGLIPALTTHLSEFRKRTGLQIHLTTSTAAAIEAVDSLKQTVLYRIAQEALKNVGKHAEAGLVKVTVQVDAEYVCLEVADNGKSFPVQSVLADKRRKRLGLVGMRERAEMVGGTFNIESEPGRGTTVRARIPLHNGVAE
jgi:signal transduction histidine kinase